MTSVVEREHWATLSEGDKGCAFSSGQESWALEEHFAADALADDHVCSLVGGAAWSAPAICGFFSGDVGNNCRGCEFEVLKNIQSDFSFTNLHRNSL